MQKESQLAKAIRQKGKQNMGAVKRRNGDQIEYPPEKVIYADNAEKKQKRI